MISSMSSRSRFRYGRCRLLPADRRHQRRSSASHIDFMTILKQLPPGQRRRSSLPTTPQRPDHPVGVIQRHSPRWSCSIPHRILFGRSSTVAGAQLPFAYGQRRARCRSISTRMRCAPWSQRPMLATLALQNQSIPPARKIGSYEFTVDLNGRPRRWRTSTICRSRW